MDEETFKKLLAENVYYVQKCAELQAEIDRMRGGACELCEMFPDRGSRFCPGCGRKLKGK